MYQNLFFQQEDKERQDQISHLMAECKQLAREVKKKRPYRRSLPTEIRQSFPRQQVIDELIQLYFTTFESCYRILHFPSFQTEYQNYLEQPEAAKSSFVVLLLLVMSAAGILHSDADIRHEITAKIPTWIHISQTWLSAPLEKNRLTLKGIQIHCLLLLARQVNRVGADLVWISTGSLLRMAMQMGLHQDPGSLGNMDLRQMEIRRRLWYTILEVNAQAALDSGMPPMITSQDYNTQPPSDLSDASLEDEEGRKHWEKTRANSIQASFQCLMARSVTLRLEAAKVINSLQDEPPYDRILSLGNDLADACRQAAMKIGHGASTDSQESTNQFAWSFCAHLLLRFPLCLHFGYAARAKHTPIYAYSQRVGLEIALQFVSLLDDPLYSQVLINGGGMFRDLITRGTLMIYLELNSDLQPSITMFATQKSRARPMLLLKDFHRVLQYAKDRLCHGETNFKSYYFLSISAAELEALVDGLPVENAMNNAARESLVTFQEIMKSIEPDNSSNDTYTSLESWVYDDMVSPPTTSDPGFDFLNSFDHNGTQLDMFQAWTDGSLGQSGNSGPFPMNFFQDVP
jgi:Fungal specific transcription factor domain